MIFSDQIEIRWDETKNRRLKKIRNVSFVELLAERYLAIRKHPKKEHQSLLLMERAGYVWVIPFVTSPGAVFLKTLFPSRYWTGEYRKRHL